MNIHHCLKTINQSLPLALTMTLSLCPLIRCVLVMRTDYRFLILIDSPSICMQVISSWAGRFMVIQKGPLPCRARAPDRTTRSRARLSSVLKLTNSSSPSSTFCSSNSWCFRCGTETCLVRHTFRSPAMQLVQLRHTSPQQPAFSGYAPSSIQMRPSFMTLGRSEEKSPSGEALLLWVMECTVCSRRFMGRKKLRKPISPQTTLLRKAMGVRWRSTVQTTLASRPIPTQFENILRKDCSCRWISRWSLISQIIPSGKVLTSTSHMSQNPIAAFIQSFTKSPSPRRSLFDTRGPLEPHPKLRLKSFPVPIGRIPITTRPKSTSAPSSSESTQGMVPSPPQITTRQSIPSWRERLRVSARPLALETVSKRSKIQSWAEWLDSYRMVS